MAQIVEVAGALVAIVGCFLLEPALALVALGVFLVYVARSM